MVEQQLHPSLSKRGDIISGHLGALYPIPLRETRGTPRLGIIYITKFSSSDSLYESQLYKGNHNGWGIPGTCELEFCIAYLVGKSDVHV